MFNTLCITNTAKATKQRKLQNWYSHCFPRNQYTATAHKNLLFNTYIEDNSSSIKMSYLGYLPKAVI